jgi:DnaK suppressor protein
MASVGERRRTIGGDAAMRAIPDDQIRQALLLHKAELDGEVAELAEPVRAPGVQIPFGKRAGDHTADAVTQMQRSISASELNHMSVEIDRALAKLDDGTYGVCDACEEPIVEARLEALPWATMCVACKSSGREPKVAE